MEANTIPEIKGKVLGGGADRQTVREDGTADLVAKYSLMTDDGLRKANSVVIHFYRVL